MEAEAPATEVTNGAETQVEPQVVEKPAESVVISEVPVHTAQNVKLESLESYPPDGTNINASVEGDAGEEPTQKEIKPTQQLELQDNLSSDGHEPSDASIISVVKAEVDKPEIAGDVPSGDVPEGNPPPKGPWDDAVPVQAGLSSVTSNEPGLQPENTEVAEDLPSIKLVHNVPGSITVSLADVEPVGSPKTPNEEPTVAVEPEEPIAVQKGTSSDAGIKVDHPEIVVPKSDEATPVVTIDPVSGEVIQPQLEISKEIEPKVKVETPVLKKSQSTTSLEKETPGKKKKLGRFHISFNRGRDSKKPEARKTDSLDRRSTKSIGTSVKQVWEHLSQSIKRREKSPLTVNSKARPPRPPPVAHRLETKSLTNSPILSRKPLLREALPDFIEALPSDDISKENGTAGETELDMQQNRILSWTSANIANEGMIHPQSRQHPYFASEYAGLTLSAGHPSPKPPRPTSPPSVTPLDYQHYHSEDGFSQADVVHRRVQMMQSVSSPGSEINLPVRGSSVAMRTPTGQGSNYPRPQTAFSDQRQQSDVALRAPTHVRRAQTLRTDYANRLRERVLSLRVDPEEAKGDSGTLRARKSRMKKESYVCSDTITFPKLSLKFGKKQKGEKPAAKVHPEIGPVVIPRPQPNFFAAPPEDRRAWGGPLMINSYEPEIVRSEGMCVRGSPGQLPSQLTGLPSMAGQQYGYQRPRIITADSSAKEYDITTNSYLSGELRLQLEEQTQMEHLKEAAKATQPFLASWDEMEGEQRPRDSSPQALEHVMDCIRSYLATCIRLRSADLQGHFAPTQYQLANFEAGRWRNVARLAKWQNVLVVTGADGTVEYLQMIHSPSVRSDTFFTNRCVDIMLTNWLDRHHSNPQLASDYQKLQPDVTYQPVSFISTLARVVDTSPFTSSSVNDLYQLGIRLAVLLTYESCLSEACSESVKPATKLDDILLGWSTSNCTVLFRLEKKTVPETVEPQRQQPAEPEKAQEVEEQKPPVDESSQPQATEEDTQAAKTTDVESDIEMLSMEAEKKPEASTEEAVEESPSSDTDSLVKSLCPEYNTVEEAIDGLIEKMYDTASFQLNPVGIGSCLLKSIAPPDWMAMLVARIGMHKI